MLNCVISTPLSSSAATLTKIIENLQLSLNLINVRNRKHIRWHVPTRYSQGTLRPIGQTIWVSGLMSRLLLSCFLLTRSCACCFPSYVYSCYVNFSDIVLLSIIFHYPYSSFSNSSASFSILLSPFCSSGFHLLPLRQSVFVSFRLIVSYLCIFTFHSYSDISYSITSFHIVGAAVKIFFLFVVFF